MAATPKLTGTSSTGEAQTSLPLTDATPLEQNCDVPASGPIDLPIEVGEHARTHARTWIAEERDSDWAALKRKLRKAKRSLESAYGNHGRKAAASDFPPPLREELLINRLLVQSVVQDVQDTLANKLVVPQIVVGGEKVPRAYVAAKSYLAAVDYQFDEDSYRTYMQKSGYLAPCCNCSYYSSFRTRSMRCAHRTIRVREHESKQFALP
jgi:hypothetical protein